ncbi:MAG TPA: hypothetical protein VGE21_10600 [Flavobacteriales bacterium]
MAEFHVFRPLRTLAFLFALALVPFVSAQVDNVYVYGTVKDYNNAKKLDGITVTVFKNGTKLAETITNASGKYEFNLDYGSDFKIVYSKSGMVSKNILIDTKNIPEEDRAGGHGMNVEMTLFNELPGMDFSILQQPIGKAKFDPANNDVTWDLQYTEQIRSEIARLMKEYDDKKKREAGAEADYAKLMAAGEAAMTAADYKKAMDNFGQALAAKAGDAKATARLSDAKMKFDELENAKKGEAQYAALIKEADALFGKKEYESAKGKYQQALEVKDETHPKQRIKECDTLIAEAAKKAEEERKAKELEDKYNAAIAAGDASMKGPKPEEPAQYEAARVKYQEASTLKPAEKYPKDQLAAITKKLEELAKKAEDDKKNKELNAKYDAAIAAGDAAFKAKQWEAAKAKYTEALAVKAEEKYPKDQIAAADKAIADAADTAAKERAAKELEANYKAAITAADAAFKGKQWDAAKAKYNEALTLKAEEKYPKDQLSAIDKAIADAADAAEKERLAKELNDKYDAAIAAGDAAFRNKGWDEAKTAYNEAIGLKSAEKYPKDQLAAIAKAIADADKQAENERLAKEKDDKYNALIAAADEAFGAKEWDKAKGKYNEALGVKSAEKYPKDQLAAIDLAIKNAADQAKQLEIQAKYDALMEEAEGHYAAEKYQEAKGAFQKALGVKPDENRPKERIVEIDAKLAELARLAEEERKRKDLDDRYNAFVAKADAAFGSSKFPDALNEYRNALALKPDEQHPKDRIAEITSKMDADAQAKAEADRLAKEKADADKRYADLIAQADRAFAAQKYEEARAPYTDASAVRPEEAYPKDRLADIDRLIAEKAAAEEAARLKAEADAAEKARLAEEERLRNASKAELDARYNAAIVAGDKAFNAASYEEARGHYEEALTVKAGEKHPTDRIAEIERRLAELAAQSEADRLKAEQEAAERARLEAERLAREQADADAARLAEEERQRKLQEITDLDTRYRSAIQQADASLAAQTYEEARGLYAQALDIKPEEVYPQSKIEQIDRLLAEQERLRREAELAAQQRAVEPEPEVAGNRVDTRKEQEAEEFMREARLREEAEKYERIKRLKSEVEEKNQEWDRTGVERRTAEVERKGQQAEAGAGLYQGSEALREKNAAELAAYREALEARRISVQGTADQNRELSREAVLGDQAAIAEKEAESRARHQGLVERSQREQEEVNAARAERIERSLDRQASAREQAMATNESTLAMQQRGGQWSARGSEQVAENKTRYADQQTFLQNRAQDQRAAEKARVDAIPLNQPRSFADYNRSKLAAEYPQGVTEESYTEGNKVIIRRVVVQGNKADEYSKVIAKWGTFYFKNGQSITEPIWSRDTE